jgi:hypothetical protein
VSKAELRYAHTLHREAAQTLRLWSFFEEVGAPLHPNAEEDEVGVG